MTTYVKFNKPPSIHISIAYPRIQHTHSLSHSMHVLSCIIIIRYNKYYKVRDRILKWISKKILLHSPFSLKVLNRSIEDFLRFFDWSLSLLNEEFCDFLFFLRFNRQRKCIINAFLNQIINILVFKKLLQTGNRLLRLIHLLRIRFNKRIMVFLQCLHHHLQTLILLHQYILLREKFRLLQLQCFVTRLQSIHLRLQIILKILELLLLLNQHRLLLLLPLRFRSTALRTSNRILLNDLILRFQH